MGKHILRIALVTLLCLLLGATALARPAAPSLPSSAVAVPAVLTGPGYGLAGGIWQASGSASGPGYRLDPAGGRILQGAGCCCTFLPCLLRGQ